MPRFVAVRMISRLWKVILPGEAARQIRVNRVSASLTTRQYLVLDLVLAERIDDRKLKVAADPRCRPRHDGYSCLFL